MKCMLRNLAMSAAAAVAVHSVVEARLFPTPSCCATPVDRPFSSNHRVAITSFQAQPFQLHLKFYFFLSRFELYPAISHKRTQVFPPTMQATLAPPPAPLFTLAPCCCRAVRPFRAFHAPVPCRIPSPCDPRLRYALSTAPCPVRPQFSIIAALIHLLPRRCAPKTPCAF